MKIRELLIIARIDPKTPKRRAATKKCCGWENLPYASYAWLKGPVLSPTLGRKTVQISAYD